ncbi:MAG: hypothetical protein KBF88_11090, partial [Polyangiaceae bacterium]|nr:hypothetical protein [Polyangiaceae bacterium]
MKSFGAWIWLALSAGSFSALGLACGHGSLGKASDPSIARSSEAVRISEGSVEPNQLPMLFPEYPADALDVGAAADGARRKVLGPLRFLAWPNGRMESSRDLLPAELVTAFRERPGMHAQYMQHTTGSDRWFELRASAEEAPQVLVGHLPNDGENSRPRAVIAAANKVWLANDWLAALRSPYYDATAKPVPGLDELVMTPVAAPAYGLDLTSGARGPIAGAPKGIFVSSLRAIDTMRAIATFDLLGTCVTWDGGDHWHPLGISLNVFSARSTDAGVEVVGTIRWRKDQLKRDFKPHRYLMQPEGQWEEVSDGAASTAVVQHGNTVSKREGAALAEGTSDRAELADWVERGGANERGEVFVLTKGDLLRVNLVTQQVMARVKGVMPADRLCNAIRFGAREDVGFVCSSSKVTELVRIDGDGILKRATELVGARVVTAAGNGNVLTDGSCEGPSEPRRSGALVQDKPADLTRSFCLVAPSGARTFRFDHLRGDEKMIPMRSGEMWIVSPPTAALDGRLLRVKADRTIETLPLKFSKNEPKHALWLEPMEETEEGVSGWLDLGSVTTNVTINAQGKVEIGTHSLNSTTEKKVLGGRFAIGWVGTQAYETTNGGQSWWPITFPAASAPSGGRDVSTGREMRRHCGALGCVANGWVRVGWNPPSVSVHESNDSSPRIR